MGVLGPGGLQQKTVEVLVFNWQVRSPTEREELGQLREQDCIGFKT